MYGLPQAYIMFSLSQYLQIGHTILNYSSEYYNQFKFYSALFFNNSFYYYYEIFNSK